MEVNRPNPKHASLLQHPLKAPSFLPCMGFTATSSLQFQSSLSAARKNPAAVTSLPSRTAPKLHCQPLFWKGQLSRVAPAQLQTPGTAHTSLSALDMQAAQLSCQNICDVVPAGTGWEQWQVAPAPMGARWHGHQPWLAHGWGGCALAHSSLKLGMPGADKNTALTM